MAFTWSQVRDVVDTVLDLPQAERAQYLNQACPQPELRKYVDSLILSYEHAGSFLESPVSVMEDAGRPDEDGAPWVGRRLGPYRIIEEIGHGGMGAVYRAVRADDQYQKQVAIKLVRGIHSALMLSRFRAERQILATLEHPNIARLLDGGTTEDGTPYFVMELVEGVAIDQYCDEQRLGVRERLQLFRSACSAVEYAHQKLIVHRDLKPGNILIDKEGVPKLLDFGIAKILSPDSASEPEVTAPFLRVMTPEYASPEQLAGEPVTTVSDVYSLGVVLYILLTGHRPYEFETRRLEEMESTVRDTDPIRPSVVALRAPETRRVGEGTEKTTPENVAFARGVKPKKLRRQLAGDLDNIVQMALRKQAERRYVSVEQFSEDIRRHLEGRPIRARRETFGYRAQKFVRRNRIGVTAAALVLLSLLAGILATYHEAKIARAQQAKADRRFQDVRELANSLLFELHDGIANLPGATPVRKRLVERALKYLDSLAKEARGDSSLELELAAAYDKVGDVQGQPHEANLGDLAGALASYEKAQSIRESLAKENPNALVLRELIGGYARLSDLQWNSGQQSLALETARKEIPTAQRLLGLEPNNPENKEVVARSYADQGYKEAMFGDRNSGLEVLGRGITMFEQMEAEHPDNLSLRRMLAITYGRVAEIQRMDSKGYADSLTSFRKAIDALKPVLALDPNNAEVRRVLAYYEHAIGELLDGLNQTTAAISQEHVALASFNALAAADPANAQLQVDVARVRGHIGSLLVESGDPRGALVELQQSIAMLSKMQDAKNPRSYAGYALISDQMSAGKAYVALALSRSGSAAERAEECRQAESWFRLCLPEFESLKNAEPLYEGSERVDEINRERSRCTDSSHFSQNRREVGHPK